MNSVHNVRSSYAPPQFSANHPAQKLRWRPCVGIVLVNCDGLIFTGKRRHDMLPANAPPWQFPQGGIDAGETPAHAACRELAEETGVTRTQIIYELPYWLTYDLPEALIGKALKGQFRGQRQKWFVMRHLGDNGNIRLDAQSQAEFDDWAWRPLADCVDLVVAFKRPIYEVLANRLAAFCVPQSQ